jgi:site-specific recombinase XerD
MRPFESFMAKNMEVFAAYRRQRGYAQEGINQPLIAFDRYLTVHDVTWDQMLQPGFFLQLRTDISDHPNTINKILSGLRSLFDYLVRRQIVAINPLKDIPPVPERYFVPFVFSPEQTELLLQRIGETIRRDPTNFIFDQGVYLVVVMLARCGMRINEPLRLYLHHYRPDEGSVYIERTKFRKDRLIPLPTALLVEIENYLAARKACCPGEQNPFLLAGRKCQPLKEDRVRTIFHRAVEAIGLKRPKRIMGNMTFGSPVPHSLRHAFAINTLNRIKARGISPQQALPVLSAYMGHRKYQYTAAYLKVKDAGDLAGLIDFTKSQLDVV